MIIAPIYGTSTVYQAMWQTFYIIISSNPPSDSVSSFYRQGDRRSRKINKEECWPGIQDFFEVMQLIRADGESNPGVCDFKATFLLYISVSEPWTAISIIWST